ncbi:hypothetical protein, partial [Salmonella enterica]|uniref:hypothetical protein n=1 Tax=Salmonella enterica TaxID=28901 RepID=UPI00398C7E6F
INAEHKNQGEVCHPNKALSLTGNEFGRKNFYQYAVCHEVPLPDFSILSNRRLHATVGSAQ